jgi:hypothetical protein
MTKRKKIIIGACLGVLAVLITIVVLIITSPKTSNENAQKKESTNSVSVEAPKDNKTPSEKEELKIDVSGKDDSKDNVTTPPTTTKKAEVGATPIKAAPTPKNQDKNTGGIKIGNEAPPPDNSETNAFIENLKAQGCPYCGSHTCASFFAKDQWGNLCYNPSKCPNYDITKDPVYYCQTCHKKCGDGANGTCVHFIKACNCPNCGEYVEARTCHTCK